MYGAKANTAQFALNFRGLGLPSTLFNDFSDLLSIATKGAATCLDYVSGFCVLPLTCDNYESLWNTYSFKVQFGADGTSYLNIPLATFATNYENLGSCVIFVEYLDDSYQDSQTILFGSMFFQSVYAQVLFSGQNAVTLNLFENLNA